MQRTGTASSALIAEYFDSFRNLEVADLSVRIRPDDAAEGINATRSIMQDIHLDLAECDNAILIENEQ
ncbi:hypothetical protein HAP47_0028125 [Bradyrhizobium sp. 41S5]|uniref:hypothetical protein n=1 Tax=Bradyrhizobium sp. 41S5 TaxID=1404443 RepID=UPI00156BB5E3|nr:hypothetical protein [Bradyrhizobium sp. 41S5]UFX43075.1 hypothetical protein HAP47_0028125 [Bradyrhizobium sp. 41S5]